jgi:hypothetical protein
VTAIVGGDGRSMLVAAALPVASGSAFLISEFAGYAPLQQCRLILAVGAVPCLDLAVGSVVLLLLAFARPHLLLGQVLGKLWAGTVSLRFTRRLLRRLAPTPG